MDRFMKFFIKPWNNAAMVSEAPLSRSVWKHLLMVYCTLGYSLAFALLGSFGDLFFDMGGWTTAVGFIGTLFWMSRINPWKEQRRVILFMATTFFFGTTIGPVINLFIQIDQSDIMKIIMEAVVFCACHFGAGIHDLNRKVIYQITDFSTPIFMTAWTIIYNTYPGLLTHSLFLVFLPIPWYFVIFVLKVFRYTLHIWFNFPIHLAWITLLCYFFNYPFPHLMYVYILVLGLLCNMRMYTQEAIYLATHHTDESYYVNTTITFFTEFIARMVSLIRHTVNIVTKDIWGFLRSYL